MVIKLWNWLMDLAILLFGSEGKILVIVVGFILLDLITGILSSAKNGEKITSVRAKEGIKSKLGLLINIVFGYFCDGLVDALMMYEWMPFRTSRIFLFGSLVSVYIIINEGISIIENLNCINPSMLPKNLGDFFEDAKIKFNHIKKED